MIIDTATITFMKFSALLQQYRTQAGWSKRQLADRIGVQPTYIGLLENQDIRPATLERCKQIASALGLTSSETKRLIDSAMEGRSKSETMQWMSENPILFSVPIISWEKANRLASDAELIDIGLGADHTTTTIKKANLFALVIKDGSMAPEFAQGDEIIVDPAGRPANQNYVIIADQRRPEAQLMRFLKRGKKTQLQHLADGHVNEHSEKSEIKIVGVVLEKAFKKLTNNADE